MTDHAKPAPTFALSDPKPCPCPDPECNAQCVEIGCRTHPGAALRVFIHTDRLSVMCTKCSRLVASMARLPSSLDHLKRANSARNPSNLN